MPKKILKRFLPIFAILSPLIPLAMYFWGNLYDLIDPFSVSMFLGIIAYMYFVNILIISARLKFLDSIYGHDRVMLFHGKMAFAALILGVLHRYFKLKVFSSVNEQMQYGYVSLFIFIIIMSLTLLFMIPNTLHRISGFAKLRNFVAQKLKIDYSIFKFFHNLMIVAVVFLLIHVFLASSTQENWGRMIVMPTWAAVGILLWIWHKLLKPKILLNREAKILSVNILNKNVVEIEFSRNAIKKYKAGQFVFIRFPGSAAGRDEHPYTLSSSPNENSLAITAKALGNFSSKLKDLDVGDPVAADGPYGIFTLDRNSKPVVFIAGGIGITPFYSILKANSEIKNRHINLFWGVNKPDDLVYHAKLKDIANKNELIEYIPVVAENDNNEFETGYITIELIKKYLSKDPLEYLWYFCGPPTMRKFVFKGLKDLGVKRKNIFYENFSL